MNTMDIGTQLPLIWMGLIALAVIVYIVLDGFDLGVGILFPWIQGEHHRDLMMSSVAPFWDGNETWLILGGGGLFVAFPKAYATLLPALYLPLMIMLLALIFRGVSFEFRFKAAGHQHWWDWSFSLGSWIAALMQGMILGTFVQGLPMEEGRYVGGAFGFVTPFSVACGLSLVVGYGLLGATWLILKTQDGLQARCFQLAQPLMLLLIGAVIMVSVVTPWINPAIALRWFSLPNLIYLSPVPFHTAFFTLILWLSLRFKREMLPFICTIALFILSYIGIIISLWPYIVPYELTFWDAAAVPRSQLFSLTGMMFLLPVVIAYTFYNYWVFRGKVVEKHYH